jgi:uncharacterized protein YprB with RNaseH-like and TPR domain
LSFLPEVRIASISALRLVFEADFEAFGFLAEVFDFLEDLEAFGFDSDSEGVLMVSMKATIEAKASRQDCFLEAEGLNTKLLTAFLVAFSNSE